ncbi:MAG: fumarylacetoacetate hydrolase family protein [Actinobacteria bacterium]|jgi:2-keto-4-pentenoate hydratase/2-oxohepta-3-ene-1,7-dioic acid hydratase in catechol pathway|nr:fumarylacetoacetate hydrolase family protein [Actinomycetota bacterium]
MKIVRVDTKTDDITYGGVEPEGIRLYRGSPFVAWEPTETVVDWEAARLLAPVIPTKIVCVGRNYVGHAEEMGNEVPEQPLLFLKPPTTVIGPMQQIRYPASSNELSYEAELAVVIGTVTRNVDIEDVGPHIMGYTAANDITARDHQRTDGQWTRAKGFDTFCPLGPAIDTDIDPQEGLSIISRVNGEIRQSGSTADMVFGVGHLVSYISNIMTLLPGDVILTGTPEGVGSVNPGDKIEVQIEGIGVLTNTVSS